MKILAKLSLVSGLPRGEEISQQLRKAIQGSDISLVVFSANYASSPWCLNELVETLECKLRMGRLVYPIFYNVSPSVVRNRTESFSAAFETYEKSYVCNQVDKWKATLTEAASLSGYDLQGDADGSLVKIAGLDKLESITRIDMAGCENVSVSFEESMFQILSANEDMIDIYLPMRDIPSWFRHQVSNSSGILLHMPITVPNRVIGMILWFNVGHTTSPKQMPYSDNISSI